MPEGNPWSFFLSSESVYTSNSLTAKGFTKSDNELQQHEAKIPYMKILIAGFFDETLNSIVDSLGTLLIL